MEAKVILRGNDIMWALRRSGKTVTLSHARQLLAEGPPRFEGRIKWFSQLLKGPVVVSALPDSSKCSGKEKGFGKILPSAPSGQLEEALGLEFVPCPT